MWLAITELYPIMLKIFVWFSLQVTSVIGDEYNVHGVLLTFLKLKEENS